MADNNQFVQAPKMFLSGSGVSSTATSIQVTELVKPGTTTTITMSDFGDTGYGTLEPGTKREENFSFTGITQNGDGTATFTTVTRGLDFVSPYTETSALKQAHAGGTVAVISNSAPFYNELSGKDNDETITGTWTFTNTAYPRIDDAATPPTDDDEFVPKKYADDLAIAGAPDGSETVKGLFEAATSVEVAAGDDAGSTSAPLVVRPSKLVGAVQGNLYNYALEDGTGADDTYTATLTPTLTAYVTGMLIVIKLTIANTATATLNIDGLGAKVIEKYANGSLTALETGDISANQTCILTYNGSSFTLLSPVASGLSTSITDEVEAFFGNTDITAAQAEELTDGSTTALHNHGGVHVEDPGITTEGSQETADTTKITTVTCGFAPKYFECIAELDIATGDVWTVGTNTNIGRQIVLIKGEVGGNIVWQRMEKTDGAVPPNAHPALNVYGDEDEAINAPDFGSGSTAVPDIGSITASGGAATFELTSITSTSTELLFNMEFSHNAENSGLRWGIRFLNIRG